MITINASTKLLLSAFLAKASINFSSRLLNRAADAKVPESVIYLQDAELFAGMG
ncbi:hypothetical protein HPP92_016130 [Vanilla planifolia]|uniref:Uncharacterized protein n=1 Tax=Vanilla planifolia TaxID=51239 RepID=A0A835QKX7_VANPL|nr:hypothetical protein HPP92_016130 [Vanilla planifolia]